MRTCSVEGCENKHFSKGYCSKHYQQIRKHGSILERTTHDANEIIEYDDYAEVILYNKNYEEIARAIIDLNDVNSVKQYKWCLHHGYVLNNKVGRLHRFLMDPPGDMVVDHINHNKLDNRRENLRICTHQENDWNKPLKSTNSSGIIGVCWDKSRNKWLAQICINGKIIYLGHFTTKEEAAEVRKQAEIEYFGEYAPNTQD